jgi:hypothetical protein
LYHGIVGFVDAAIVLVNVAIVHVGVQVVVKHHWIDKDQIDIEYYCS